MAQTIDQLVQEAKDFLRLKRKFKQQALPDQGSVAYLVSRNWLAKYKKFLFYNEIKNNMKPEPSETHFEHFHPGPISNKEDLLYADVDSFLTSGRAQENYEDDFVEEGKREQVDFKIVDEDIWAFLHEKYGGYPIKRFYHRVGGTPKVEVKLLKLPIVLGSPSDFKKMQEDNLPATFLQKTVAASQHQGYAELKKRLVICLQNFFGDNYTTERIRLWKIDQDVNSAIFEAFKQKDSHFKQDKSEEKAPVQVNSNVIFPGESLENFVGSSFKLSDETFD